MKILFVCIGNAIRSQMAEGFARSYGNDQVIPASCGLHPAMTIDPKTVAVMSDIGIDVKDQFSKPIQMMAKMEFDLVVNISGHQLPVAFQAPVRKWDIPDPVGKSEEEFRKTRDLIQKFTLQLLDEVANK